MSACAWMVMAVTFVSLHLTGHVSLEFEYDYAISAVTFTNATIDLYVLILPIEMTRGIQILGKQKAGVIGIFALDSG